MQVLQQCGSSLIEELKKDSKKNKPVIIIHLIHMYKGNFKKTNCTYLTWIKKLTAAKLFCVI